MIDNIFREGGLISQPYRGKENFHSYNASFELLFLKDERTGE